VANNNRKINGSIALPKFWNINNSFINGLQGPEQIHTHVVVAQLISFSANPNDTLPALTRR
jgi:hypothetical protein